jgi:hypothetical protein
MLHKDKTRFNSLNTKRNQDHSHKANILTQSKQHSLINFLYKKYSTKYNIKEDNQQLRHEIAKYAEHMKSSVELACLDKIVENMFKMPRSSSLNEVGKSIVKTDTGKELVENIKRTNFLLNEANKDAVKVEKKRIESRESRMSGASELSEYASHLGRKKDKDDRMNQIRTLMNKLGNKEEVVKLEGNEWSLLADYNKILFIKDKENRLMKKKEKQEILKKELDKQLQEKNIVKKKENEERALYGKMVIARVDEFKRIQIQNKLENFRKSVELKVDRDKFLEEDRMKKKHDFILSRSKELEIGINLFYLVNLSRLRLEEELKKIDDKKRIEKGIFKQSLEEQKILVDLKKQIRVNEKIAAYQLDKQNEEIHEKMDRERKKNRKRITKSFDGVFNYISNVNSQKENEIKEFEENFVNGASNRSNNSITVKNDLDSFHKKKELKDYLDQQVNLKIEMKRKNDMEERDYGNFLEEVKNKFVEESKNNIIKKKNINKENIEFLRKQIEAKKDVKNNGMNMHEYSMNKDILSNYYRESSLYK